MFYEFFILYLLVIWKGMFFIRVMLFRDEFLVKLFLMFLIVNKLFLFFVGW